MLQGLLSILHFMLNLEQDSSPDITLKKDLQSLTPADSSPGYSLWVVAMNNAQDSSPSYNLRVRVDFACQIESCKRL